MKPNALAKAPELVRLAAATGESPANVSEATGFYEAGAIEGVSLCVRGPALGHGFWIDMDFIESVTEAAMANERTKSRFTHPGLCSDGMGKALGTIDNCRTKGDRSIGDLSFFKSSHIAPDGDLAAYVISLSKESPESFGLSIVFRHDMAAETEFALAHGAVMDMDDDGFPFVNYTNFKSPDELNVNNMPHCRLADLRACDVVDEPAANPDGLFHRQNELLSDGSKLLAYLLDQSNELGQVKALSSLGMNFVAPERLKSFVSNYLAAAGLSLVKENEMAAGNGKPSTAPAALAEDEKKAADTPADGKPVEEKADGMPEKDPVDCEEDPAKSESKCGTPDATLPEYCAAFGYEDGAKFFLAGKTFREGQAEQLASLRAQLKDRDDKLAAFAKLGVEPVGFSPAEDKKRDGSNKSALGDSQNIDNRAAFAAAISKTEK